jgi:hypothetical protein
MEGFLSHIRIQATLVMSTTFAGGFGLRITAVVTLAIDLDPGNNGIGGPDHAVLLDLKATPVITGPPCDHKGTPSFELGGTRVAASVYWKVGGHALHWKCLQRCAAREATSDSTIRLTEAGLL